MAELQIPITKGKGTITINTDDVAAGGDLTADVFREALIQGLKVILNRGMSKITKESFRGDEEKMKAAAMAKAEETFKDMKENKIRFTGGKPKKEITGEVMTEAMRLARNLVKQGLKDEGIKISHVDAKEITKAAKQLIADYPAILTQAKDTVAARKEASAKGIQLGALAKAIPINEKKKAKVEAEAAERKKASSAKKSGKVEMRAKPQEGQRPTAH